MPTRDRKRRTRAAKIPDHIVALFHIGCARNSYTNAEYDELWSKYGATFRRMAGDDFPRTWAASELTPPTTSEAKP